VAVDVVPYQAILENLPVQLAAGEGPDLAKVTDLGGLNEYYLDLAPYVDAPIGKKAFGGTLDWYRGGPTMMASTACTPADRHRRLRQRHPVRAGRRRNARRRRNLGRLGRSLPRSGRSHRHAPFPMAIDRSGHRVAGPAISYGAALFDENGDADPGR
jgi:alpha-1,4-digalacturonate transport system substrate-binding protein